MLFQKNLKSLRDYSYCIATQRDGDIPKFDEYECCVICNQRAYDKNDPGKLTHICSSLYWTKVEFKMGDSIFLRQYFTLWSNLSVKIQLCCL